MKHTVHWRTGVAIAVLLLLAAACANPAQQRAGGETPAADGSEPEALDLDVDALVEGAREEGTLALNWGGAEWLPDVVELFNEEYGLDIQLEHTPATDGEDAAVRLIQEFEAGRPAHTDLAEASAIRVHVLNGGRDTASVINPIDWASLPNIEPEMITDDGLAVILQHVVPTLTYNTDRVDAGVAPQSLQEALDLCLEGEYRFVTTSTTWESLLDPDAWGPERTMAFVEQYGPCLSGFIGTQEMERVASGEFDVAALDANDYRTKPLIEDGAPLALVVPSDFVALKASYFALPLNSQRPNTAVLFGDFLLSPAAQAVLYEYTYADNHFVEGSRAAAETRELMNEIDAEPFQINYEHFRDNFDLMESYEEELDQLLEGTG